ncbi:unnamed protein product [Adineta steineri]|nr:unnamed protein product [Adineta steineri]
MKWKKDATEGNIVAGGNGQGNSLKELSSPRGVIVDHLGDKNGEIVIGGNSVGDGSNQLNAPASLSFDVEGNLYVADV